MEKQTKIKLLQSLIQINSANGNEQEMAEFIAATFAKYDIQSDLIPYAEHRSSIIAEIGPKDSSFVLALSSHLDTVAVGDPNNWQHDPFSGEIIDDSIYGRGSADMKSGMAAMIIAMIELKESQITLTGRVRFIGTVGEELGAMGALELTKHGYVHDVSTMILGEPTSGNIIYAHSGSIDYTVNSHGIGAHSSMPERGNNAINNLVDFINAEKSAFDDAPDSPVLGPLVHSVTVINGGQQVNSIPEFATLQGNIRPVPEFNASQSIQRLQEIIDQLNQQPQNNLELQVDFSFDPVVNDPNDPFITSIKKARQKSFGNAPTLGIIHGATDASEYVKDSHSFPKIVLGAGEWNDAHSIDESVSIDNFLKVSETYLQVIKQECVS